MNAYKVKRVNPFLKVVALGHQIAFGSDKTAPSCCTDSINKRPSERGVNVGINVTGQHLFNLSRS